MKKAIICIVIMVFSVVSFAFARDNIKIEVLQSASSDSSKYAVIDSPVLDTTRNRTELKETILVGDTMRLKYELKVKRTGWSYLGGVVNKTLQKDGAKIIIVFTVPKGVELLSYKGICKFPYKDQLQDKIDKNGIMLNEEDGGCSICYPYYQFMDVSDDYDGYYFALDSADKNSASVEFNFMPKGAGKYAISIDAFIQGKDELKDLADSKQYYTVQVI